MEEWRLRQYAPSCRPFEPAVARCTSEPPVVLETSISWWDAPDKRETPASVLDTVRLNRRSCATAIARIARSGNHRTRKGRADRVILKAEALI
jgi:hypothetical protein